MPALGPSAPFAREEVLPPTALLCDVCGAPAFEARCKVICRRCGYTRDCSDP